jgi:hypothetical protein
MIVAKAYLDRQSGKIYWYFEFGDNHEKLPDDIEDEKYIAIPDEKELQLGKALVFDSARKFLPDNYDEVRQIFNQRGAYRRFKDFWCGGAPSNASAEASDRSRRSWRAFQVLLHAQLTRLVSVNRMRQFQD